MLNLLKRKPDFVIGSADDPYLLRWYVIPMNRYFNIYLHNFRRSDDDRALHDHPWWNLSIILRGGYWEHLPVDSANLKTRRWWRRPFKPYFRTAMAAHRIELDLPITGPVWSLFFTGPKIRTWGFWCPQGWRRWTEFVSLRDGGNSIGRGCD